LTKEFFTGYLRLLLINSISAPDKDQSFYGMLFIYKMLYFKASKKAGGRLVIIMIKLYFHVLARHHCRNKHILQAAYSHKASFTSA